MNNFILIYNEVLDVHDCPHNELDMIEFLLFYFFSWKNVVRFHNISNDFVQMNEWIGESRLYLWDTHGILIIEINEWIDHLFVTSNVI